MSSVWVIIILITVMIAFIITIQIIAKQQGQTILTKKDVLKALKDKINIASKDKDEQR
ncbi:hypothetical protein SM124_00835 [Bacillus sp. 31A1R]|uniref:Uncharacterized protein n=1 Tax=Robertmurraya mangrovi TaxID=3098077 RepID=A0ABU5IT19_9BACI|nr:hypothetical protein [Bacillus sp. 31A1R]MDZ5470281.1 hypothetical protein [Bacillus sp. 31A1R]